jgi:hypothetical protein
MFYVEYYDPIAMIIVLHLLNDNWDRVTGFYWSSECDVTFSKQTWPNICDHMIQIGLQSLQWTNI